MDLINITLFNKDRKKIKKTALQRNLKVYNAFPLSRKTTLTQAS